MLRTHFQITKDRVIDAVAIETAYINRKHPDFNTANALLTDRFSSSFSFDGTVTTIEQQKNCKILEKLISDYFVIVKKSTQDTVIKTIMHFLVNVVKDRLESELLEQLYAPGAAEELLQETDRITMRRKSAKETLNVGFERNAIV